MIDRIKDAPIGTKLYIEDIICTEPGVGKINLGALTITIDNTAPRPIVYLWSWTMRIS